jgi:hypothetical protein
MTMLDQKPVSLRLIDTNGGTSLRPFIKWHVPTMERNTIDPAEDVPRQQLIDSDVILVGFDIQHYPSLWSLFDR